MRKVILFLTIILFSTQVLAGEVLNLPADIALHRLKEGNIRFSSYQMKHPNISKKRREKLIVMQRPYAAVLSCSDSVAAPEIIFDQGLGDIFVIRNAGNVLDEHVLGSLEYALHHLGIKLVIVLSHQSCGAVGEAMKDNKESPAIESIKESIMPAVNTCRENGNYTYENVIKTHAQLNVKEILEDKELGQYIEKHAVKVIPAYYDITTGEVEFLKEI